jgi:phosphoribosylanthranilate isomerase
MPVRAKICGIRSQLDLHIAVEAGADAVGFICGVTHESEDALDEDAARALVRQVPPYVSTVLVTHLTEADEVLRLAGFLDVDTIQLHGVAEHEAVARVFAAAGRRRVTKAIHIESPEAVAVAETFLDVCDALHLDSRTAGRLGGTGKVHDWSISRRVVELAWERARRPTILAGGLRPENLVSAIQTVGPFAVDVNSGVDDEHGDKDPARVAAFVSLAHSSPTAAEADPG